MTKISHTTIETFELQYASATLSERNVIILITNDKSLLHTYLLVFALSLVSQKCANRTEEREQTHHTIRLIPGITAQLVTTLATAETFQQSN